MSTSGAIGQDLLHIPLGELLRSVTMAIADAQFQLDRSSMRMAEFMSGKHVLRGPDDDLVDDKGNRTGAPSIVDSRIYFGFARDAEGRAVPQQLSMMELGFVPTFYQFVDTLIEIKLAMRVNRGPGDEVVVSSTPVDAGYAASYGYSADLACVIKTKLVPVPPPATLSERLRILTAEAERAAEEKGS